MSQIQAIRVYYSSDILLSQKMSQIIWVTTVVISIVTKNVANSKIKFRRQYRYGNLPNFYLYSAVDDVAPLTAFMIDQVRCMLIALIGKKT